MVQDAKGTVALERSYRMLRMLSDCNRILVRSTDESRLLNDLCRLLLEQGGCTAVWVGIVQDDITGTVRTAAHAGFQENIPAAFGLSERESDAAFEAWVAQVIRTGQMQCCDDPCRAFAGMRRTFASQQGDVLSLLSSRLVPRSEPRPSSCRNQDRTQMRYWGRFRNLPATWRSALNASV